MHHNHSSPMFFVGHADDKVTEFSGNFFLADYVDERIPLTGIDTEVVDGYYAITFNLSQYWVSIAYPYLM